MKNRVSVVCEMLFIVYLDLLTFRPNGQRQRNVDNGEPIGNHLRSFEWYRRFRWPLRTPLPQNRGPKCTHRTNFAMRAATWRIW